MPQCNEAKTVGIETREVKRKNGEAREAEQGEEEEEEEERRDRGRKRRRRGGRVRNGTCVEETSGNNTRAWRKHLRVLLSIIYRSAPCARSLPFGITIYTRRALCFRPLKTHPVVVGPSGASSWTASAGGTSAFSI